MAVRQAALVSDESALEACLRRCAIQIDDLYLFTFTGISIPILLGYLVSIVRSPSLVWDRAPAKNEFGAF